MPFRLFAFSLRNNATRQNEKTSREKTKKRHAQRRKDEIISREKTKEHQAKRRNDAMRKTKNATRKDDKLAVLNGIFTRGVLSSLRVGISTFRMEGFVFFFFFLFFFCLFAWRYFVLSHGVISSFRLVFFRLFA